MGRTLIRNATIFTATGEAPFTGDVLVEGNRIAAVSPSDKASHGGASLPMGVDEIHFHGAVSPLADISGRALLVGRKTAGAIHTADVTLVDTNGVPRVTLTGVRTVRRP